MKKVQLSPSNVPPTSALTRRCRLLPGQTLQRHGLDLFPEEDSYLYIEGTSLKHQPCEKHLYWCMALVGNAYGFSSSRWNLLAGAENLVLQFKEMLSEQLQVGQME